MMRVASFLVLSPLAHLNPLILLSSPSLPLLLSFRSLYLTVVALYQSKHIVLSRILDFATSVAMMRWAQDLGCDFRRAETTLCCVAAKNGLLDVLCFLRTQSSPPPWNAKVCAYAAAGGHWHVLEWARSQEPPCDWDEETCSSAALNGHLHLLQWARSQDPPCDWDEGTCSSAAENGHLCVLEWARSQDPPCPWDVDECIYRARRGGQVGILDWFALHIHDLGSDGESDPELLPPLAESVNHSIFL